MRAVLHYESPIVLGVFSLEASSAVLAGSVEAAFIAGGVDSAGQEVEEIDLLNDNSFKHEWQ